MKQVVGLTSTYSSDEFGVCSALYELGGMVVMHDASGCNSTYTTHDEPRWYDQDSMIFISAISEMEAIMGDDDKFIEDLVQTANELKPKFIALVGAPIPYMMGTDFDAIAQIVEERTGIPSFGFMTNGMQYYPKGISMAMERIVDFYCTEKKETQENTVNILGATPLDFSINGSVESIEEWLTNNGYTLNCNLAMNCSLEDIQQMSSASINLVISSGGLKAAKLLESRFGIPYVVGVPYGKVFSNKLLEKLKAGKTCMGWEKEQSKKSAHLALIGEVVTSISLATAIELENDVSISVLDPLDKNTELYRTLDVYVPEEDNVMEQIKEVDGVIADPLYKPLCGNKDFYSYAHVAFSGRIFEKEIPNLINTEMKRK